MAGLSRGTLDLWSGEHPDRNGEMMETMTVPASEVRKGDFLTGLDNGYVYEPPSDDPPPYHGNVARGSGVVSIGFHTAEGDEGELIVPAEMPVQVSR